jgi:hypothetical protein
MLMLLLCTVLLSTQVAMMSEQSQLYKAAVQTVPDEVMTQTIC